MKGVTLARIDDNDTNDTVINSNNNYNDNVLNGNIDINACVSRCVCV